MNIGIIGLGLMGGSLALDLKDLGYKVKGFVKNKQHQQEILNLNLVDELVDFQEIEKCDVIFLAIPVDAIIYYLKELKNINKKQTIIDLGSTKNRIVKEVPQEIRKNLIPAHPMTGTEKSGPTSAFKGLYKNKIVVLTDLKDSGKKQKKIAIKIFRQLEMNIIKMKSKAHDKHAGFISHLPHTISFALANTVMGQEDPKSILALAAGGFRDMSRIAKSNPAMWVDIFKQNRKLVLKSMDIFEKEFNISKKLIKNENWKELYKWMEKATTLHNILK